MVTGHQELVRKWIFGLDLYQDPTNVLVDTQIHALKRKSGVIAIQVKFIYSEKATKFCEIFLLLLTTVHTVKSKGKISQNFVAFSECMNFTKSHDTSPLQGPSRQSVFFKLTDG